MAIQPPIFILNLPYDKERRVVISKQLESLSLEYEFVEAIDGSKLTAEEVDTLCQGQPQKYIGRQMSAAEVACYLSHIKVMEIICKRNISVAVILEDDVIVGSDFDSFLMHSHRIPQYCKVLELGVPNDYAVRWGLGKVRIYQDYEAELVYPFTYGAYGYLIRQTLCAKVIDQAYPIIAPIDNRLFNFFHSVDFSYRINKPLVFHDDNSFSTHMKGRSEFSNIEKHNRNKVQSELYKGIFSKFINLSIYYFNVERLIAWLLLRYGHKHLHKNACLSWEKEMRHTDKVLFLLKILLGRT